MADKYAAIDFAPPDDVRKAALRGLALRKQYGRGGLDTQQAGDAGIGSGVARARDLANGKQISPETIGRMLSFFARHEGNKNTPPEKGNGQIAWLLWGGDAGLAWARKVQAQMETADRRMEALQDKAQNGRDAEKDKARLRAIVDKAKKEIDQGRERLEKIKQDGQASVKEAAKFDKLPNRAKRAFFAKLYTRQKAAAGSLSAADDFVKGLKDSSPTAGLRPTGRATKGQGQEFKDRRWIANKIEVQSRYRQKLRDTLNDYRGTKAGQWEASYARERVNILTKTIDAALQIANDPAADWSFKREMVNELFGYASFVST